MSKAVILHSGGLDSTVLLHHAHASGFETISLGVHYGQRHERELQAAREVCERLGVERVELDLSALRTGGVLAGSSLTDDAVPVPHGHYEEPSMKATVVPNRNMVLLAVAGMCAVSRGAKVIGYAAHAGDHAVYPDCRPKFADAMQRALALCDYEPIDLWRPFIEITKAGIVELGAALAVPMGLTWSCYEGGELHCGKCGTCVERREAFELAGVPDPTRWA